MTDNEGKITILYDPDNENAQVRCDFPGEDPDDRDERIDDLFQAVLHAASDDLEKEGIRALAGGEVREAENAVAHSFGTDDEIPMG